MSAEGSAALGELVPADLQRAVAHAPARRAATGVGAAVTAAMARRGPASGSTSAITVRTCPATIRASSTGAPSARRDRLILRQTEAEDELPIVLAVDVGANMGYGDGRGSKLAVARALAGCARVGGDLRQGDAVGLVLAGRR